MPFVRTVVLGTALAVAASAALAGDKIVTKPIYLKLLVEDGTVLNDSFLEMTMVSREMRMLSGSETGETGFSGTNGSGNTNGSGTAMPIANSAGANVTDLVALRARLLEEKRARGLD